MNNVSVLDRLYLALWLFQQGRAYWPGNSLGEGHKFIEDKVRPYVEGELGTGRLEDGHTGNILLQMMDASNRYAHKGDTWEGYRPANPFIAALGMYNNAPRHIADGDIGFDEIPAIYEKEDAAIHQLKGLTQAYLREQGVESPSWKDFRFSDHDIPWTIAQDESGAWSVTFDEEYEPDPVVKHIMGMGARHVGAH